MRLSGLARRGIVACMNFSTARKPIDADAHRRRSYKERRNHLKRLYFLRHRIIIAPYLYFQSIFNALKALLSWADIVMPSERRRESQKYRAAVK